MKHIISFLAFFLCSFCLAQPVFSHSGRTDSSGCHTNRKTGEYHCHSKKLTPKIQRNKSSKPESTWTNLKRKPKTKPSNSIQVDSGSKGAGPYKWEDENGLHIVFDINRVPEHLRDKIQKK